MIRGNICVNNIDGVPLCFSTISANFSDTFSTNPTTSLSNSTIHSHYNHESKSRILMGYSTSFEIKEGNDKENNKENTANKVSVKNENNKIIKDDNSFKLAILSHGNCNSDCTCQMFASNFLLHYKNSGEEKGNKDESEDVNKFCEKNFHFLTHLKSPLLIVLLDNDQLYSISYYAANEFFIKRHPLGSYIINDYFLEIPHPRLRNLNFNQLNNVITSPGCDNDNLITQIVEYFSEKIVFWPKSNRIGFGVVFNDQILTFKSHHVGSEGSGIEGDKLNRPKGAITGFNFFSKEARKKVLENCEGNLSNNGLNKKLGDIWKKMTEEEKKPYNDKAIVDKARYNEELRNFTAGKNKKEGKAVTAYNHFVHQEKQFIHGLQYSDAQTRMGRHAGDRWGTMNLQEKKLYEILHEVEKKYYI